MAATASGGNPVCSIFRIPNGARFVGKGQIVAVPSPFDFAGAFIPSGRGLFFDAKSVAADSKINGLRVGAANIVKPHQIEALCRLGNTGAVAGFLVMAGPVGRWLWLPAHCAMHRRRTTKWGDVWWVDLGSAGEVPNFAKLSTLVMEGG